MVFRPTIFIMFPVLILLLFASIAVLVLLVRLCIKKPWVAAIIALVLMFLLVPIIILHPVSHRRIISYEQQAVPIVPSVIQSGDTTAAIWSPGIEDQFEADIYPSQISAVRSLGLRMAKPVRNVFGDQASPKRIIVLKGNIDHQLVQEFGNAVAKAFPETSWFARNEWSGIEPNEVGMKLEYVDVENRRAQWKNNADRSITSGRIEATAMVKDKQSTINARFVEKPWIDDFAEFLNNKPNSRFLVAKSSESCLSEAEANRQAIENACAQLGPLLTKLRDPIKLSSNDILENGMVVDRFVQSFYGSAGNIWRQALLIDVSNEKLNQLVRRNVMIARARRFGFIRTISSIAGLFILIIIVYAFLNAATKGYYTWSLRIAGFVLALILIFIFFG
jgi:hypothetical protein